MKTMKTILILAIVFMLSPVTLNAQETNNHQSYWIHEDQVKPSKQGDYEKITKEFIEACKKHNLKGADWATARVNNGTYLSITPINNMSDFDKNPLAPLADKMGEDKFNDLFRRFNECYDKHGDRVVVLTPELSYMPNGLTTNTAGQNYRKWHFLHVTPSNITKLKAKIKEIKALYQKKGAKEYFRIYYNGFGTMGDYYLVTISAKDEKSYIELSNQTETLLGDEGKKLMGEMFLLLDKYETTSGWMRPDLGYTAK